MFLKYIVYSIHCVSVYYTTVYCINKVYTIYVFGNLYVSIHTLKYLRWKVPLSLRGGFTHTNNF